MLLWGQCLHLERPGMRIRGWQHFRKQAVVCLVYAGTFLPRAVQLLPGPVLNAPLLPNGVM